MNLGSELHEFRSAGASPLDLGLRAGVSGCVQGVMLTHANLLSVVAGQLGAINQVGGRYGQTFTEDDVMISYLPLAHIFDRSAQAASTARSKFCNIPPAYRLLSL